MKKMNAVSLLPIELKRIILASFIDINSRFDGNGLDRSLGCLGLDNSCIALYFISCYEKMVRGSYISDQPGRGPWWGGTYERTIDQPRQAFMVDVSDDDDVIDTSNDDNSDGDVDNGNDEGSGDANEEQLLLSSTCIFWCDKLVRYHVPSAILSNEWVLSIHETKSY